VAHVIYVCSSAILWSSDTRRATADPPSPAIAKSCANGTARRRRQGRPRRLHSESSDGHSRPRDGASFMGRMR
jgi:hypothetical protein